MTPAYLTAKLEIKLGFSPTAAEATALLERGL
jgi:hypothetical protein